MLVLIVARVGLPPSLCCCLLLLPPPLLLLLLVFALEARFDDAFSKDKLTRCVWLDAVVLVVVTGVVVVVSFTGTEFDESDDGVSDVDNVDDDDADNACCCCCFRIDDDV